MRYDYQATLTFVDAYDTVQRQAVDYLLGTAKAPPALGHLAQVTDPLARLKLLAQALATTSKSYAQSGDRRTGTGGLKQALGSLNRCFEERRRDFLIPLGLLPAPPPLEPLPDLSFALHFTFTLRKPYLSQDEAEFYVIDNPVRKDKVFGLPYIAPSQWKGALRATMVRQLVEQSPALSDEQFADQRLALALLFGDEKGEEPGEAKALTRYLNDPRPEAAAIYRNKLRKHLDVKAEEPMPHHAGRLHFYPTFFTQIGLEIINPHSRESGAGEAPILIESVPTGAEGSFTLLYVPLGLDGNQAMVGADLERVTRGLRSLLLESGLGAKTSSGYGVTEQAVKQGALRARIVEERAGEEPASPATAPPSPDLPRYLSAPGRLHLDFADEQGGLKSEAAYRALIESRGQKYAKGDKQRYDKAARWWEKEGQALTAGPAPEPEPAPPPAEERPAAHWLERSFGSLDELAAMASEIARRLAEKTGGGV